MQAKQVQNSGMYIGRVRHRRFSPKSHDFSYPLYMLKLDLDEIETLDRSTVYFANERFAPLSFRRSDYLGDPSLPLKQAVLMELQRLGGTTAEITRVELLGQVRCFGLYFSPVNLFFCYEKQKAKYMIAEVHNTPWNERHCYLVKLDAPVPSKKDFHVSPFMGMDMEYHWKIQAPSKRALVHIENISPDAQKLFDATLVLSQHEFNSKSLAKALWQWPVMSLSILKGIYWQALKLFMKAVPFHAHS